MKAFTEIYENVIIYKNMVYWERKEKNLMFCSVIERKKNISSLIIVWCLNNCKSVVMKIQKILMDFSFFPSAACKYDQMGW